MSRPPPRQPRSQRLKGRVWVYGDDVDTDRILPGRYLDLLTPEELAPHCLEGLDPDFASSVRPGDLLVAGWNFGCGSSRESAPRALLGCGVAAVVAESFGRIFYRNGLSLGLPLVVCPDIVGKVQTGDTVSIDMPEGKLTVGETAEVLNLEPLPEVLARIVETGGLVEYVRAKMASKI